MAWIPAVVASQGGNYNNRKKGIVIALIVLVLLSIMILVSQFGIFNLSNFRISFIFGGIIIFFIVFVVILTISIKSYERYNRRPYPYQYSNQRPQEINENIDKEIQYRESKSDSLRVDTITRSKVRVNYCSYCGRYLSQDAIYCPDCGKKIELSD